MDLCDFMADEISRPPGLAYHPVWGAIGGLIVWVLTIMCVVGFVQAFQEMPMHQPQPKKPVCPCVESQ